MVQWIKPLLTGPGYNYKEAIWAGKSEQIELYKILAQELRLTGPVIEVASGENFYPAQGLEEGGVELPVKAIDYNTRSWFGSDKEIDAGGFDGFGIAKESVEAVIFNHAVTFVASESKPNWREPLSWLNFNNYYQRHPL